MPKKSLKTRPEITPHTRGKIRDPKGHFLPGVSGNPGGRPRTAHLSQAYREELERIADGDHTNAELVAKRMVKTAVHGRRDPAAIMAASELADRTEGKAAQSVHFEHGMDQRTAEIIANLAARWLDGQDIPPLYPKQTFHLPEPRPLPDISTATVLSSDSQNDCSLEAVESTTANSAQRTSSAQNRETR